MNTDKYVFIVAHDDHVSFRGVNPPLSGSEPKRKESSDSVLARCVAMFSNLGYEIEIRDERKDTMETKEKIKTEAESRLANCVARFSDPEKRLEYVLCVWKRDKGVPVEWVVWTYNSQDHGFYHGHYYRDLASAVERFKIYVSTSLANATAIV